MRERASSFVVERPPVLTVSADVPLIVLLRFSMLERGDRRPVSRNEEEGGTLVAFEVGFYPPT